MSALAVARVLLGDAPPEMQPQYASDIGAETVYQCCLVQSQFWKAVDPKACEPREGILPLSLSRIA